MAHELNKTDKKSLNLQIIDSNLQSSTRHRPGSDEPPIKRLGIFDSKTFWWKVHNK